MKINDDRVPSHLAAQLEAESFYEQWKAWALGFLFGICCAAAVHFICR